MASYSGERQVAHMADSLVNPQEIFRSQLPVGALLLVIFVPSRDRDGQPVDQDYWIDEVPRYWGDCSVVRLLIRVAEASGVTTNVVERWSSRNQSSFFPT